MSHTPMPWSVEDADGTKNHQHCKVYALVDSKGKVIADCHNSEVVDIQCDPDEYGSNCWDEQGRQDFEFIAKACNFHERLVGLAQDVVNSTISPMGTAYEYGRFVSEARAILIQLGVKTAGIPSPHNR